MANVELVVLIIDKKSIDHRSNSGINRAKVEISILDYKTVMSGFDT